MVRLLLVGRLSPLRSGVHAMLTSSWCVQSWCSHSLLLHSNKPGSFPVQLTSSKIMGPDPTLKRGTVVMSSPSERRVWPNLKGGGAHVPLVKWLINNETGCADARLGAWILNVTCNQVVGTPPECWSLSSHRRTPSPTDHGKKLLNVLHGWLHPPPT